MDSIFGPLNPEVPSVVGSARVVGQADTGLTVRTQDLSQWDQSPSISAEAGNGNDVTTLILNRQQVVLGIGGYATASPDE